MGEGIVVEIPTFRHFEFHVSAVDSPRDERTDDGKE